MYNTNKEKNGPEEILFLNKDSIVASGLLVPETEAVRFTKISGRLPLGLQSPASWIENRKASKHNRHLQDLMKQCGCDTMSGFINVTHAASVNDTFWVKKADDSARWDDVSLYRNEFNETISRLAFYGLGIADIDLSSTSPELVMDGSFPKCVKKEKDGIYLYKRGHNHAGNGGLEPYGEAMTSEIASRICENTVHYDLVRLHRIPTSRCRLFTDEKYGYVPMSAAAPDKKSIADIVNYMSEFPDDSEERFREMVVCDAITFNQDRHFGNFGVLMDNDTVTPLRMAPVFDFNLAFLPYVLDSEFEHIGDKLLEYGPKIGEDFTRIGQKMLTSRIADKLKDLKDFSFRFEGDDRFTKERIGHMTSLINRQIDAVLSREVLYTKDVFVPELHLEKQKKAEKAHKRLEEAYPELEGLADRDGFLISVSEDEETQFICVEPEDPDHPSLYIDFLADKIEAEVDAKQIPVERLPEEYRPFIEAAEKYLKNRQRLVVLAGIPGSGKEEKGREIAEKIPLCEFVRTNDIRKNFPEIDQQIIFDIAYEKIRNALSAGKSVVYVATNLDEETRDAVLSCIPDGKNVQKELVVLYQNPEKANSDLPPEQLRNMAVRLRNHPPSRQEGWNDIRTVGTDPVIGDAGMERHQVPGKGDDCNLSEDEW